MVTDVYVVYNDIKQVQQIGNTCTFKVSPFFHFIDDRTSKGKKDAFKLKSQFSARLSPFIVAYDGEKPVKAFYTEADKDIIKSLINYLNEKE